MPGEAKKTVMKLYHFDVGNSNDGPIGFCARVRAKSKVAALRTLTKYLRDRQSMIALDVANSPDIEYLNVYFNYKALSIRDIDSIDKDE